VNVRAKLELELFMVQLSVYIMGSMKLFILVTLEISKEKKKLKT
jgi:hypothetical protein